MRILAIDYGRSKLGLAFSGGKLSDPLDVLRYKKVEKVLDRLDRIIKEKEIDKLVIGISEGAMADEIRHFGELLETRISIPIIYQDETMSTQKAHSLSVQTGMKRKKRKQMEDAYAASIILQSYLDNISH